MKPCSQERPERRRAASRLAAAPSIRSPREPALGARAALVTAALLASLGVSIANTALPEIASHFGSSFSETRWVVIAYLLAVTLAVVAGGRLGDVIGRRRVFLGGLALFTTASLLCALAPGLPWLIAARVLQGLGGAVSITLSQALVTETVPAGKIGRTVGLLGTASAVGTALGPSLGGFLIAGAGWRAVFAFLCALGAVAGLLALRNLSTAPASGNATARRGSVVLALLRGDPAVLPGLGANALVSTVMMGTLVAGPFYLSRTLGLGAAEVGLLMSVGPGLSILSGVPAGRLVDRLGSARIARLGLALMTGGSFLLSFLPSLYGAAGYALPIALLSPGYQLFLAANGTALLAGAGTERKGAISGLLQLSRNLGLVAGATGLGAVFAAGGLRATFVMATALSLLALALGNGTINKEKQE